MVACPRCGIRVYGARGQIVAATTLVASLVPSPLTGNRKAVYREHGRKIYVYAEPAVCAACAEWLQAQIETIPAAGAVQAVRLAR